MDKAAWRIQKRNRAGSDSISRTDNESESEHSYAESDIDCSEGSDCSTGSEIESDGDGDWMVAMREEWNRLLELCAKLKKQGFDKDIFDWQSYEQSFFKPPRLGPTEHIQRIERDAEW
jgi:hypothetical protein